VDDDRLLMGGHWTDTTLQSRVSWTPRRADPAVGDDERLPLRTDNYYDLDNYDGGPLTGISDAINGIWYAFKWSHIYQLSRTSEENQAYSLSTTSKSRGAIPGTIFSGVDEHGAACVYFLDPTMGPSRIGPSGLQVLRGLRETWKRVNLNAASVIGHGLYYPYKQQAHWWVAVDGADSPNYKLVLQVSEVQETNEAGGGCWRGWSVATGRIAEAYCSAILTEVSISGGVTSLSGFPFIGLDAPDYIQRCDVDATDAGEAFTATIRTLTGLLNKWGAMVGSLLATASSGNVTVRLIRDFGLDTNEVTVSLAPALSESHVVRLLDNLKMSESKAIQIEFSDT
jgi:hypothetical protein